MQQKRHLDLASASSEQLTNKSEMGGYNVASGLEQVGGGGELSENVRNK